MTLPSGTKLGRYQIQSKLGEGGMGEVYLAQDTTLNRKVAIKFLTIDSTASDQANKRLLREAQAAAKLDHPNICAVHEVAEQDGRSFIVMSYVEGETLDLRMKGQRLDVPDALAIAVQVADALAEAHARGIIHRDIKPSNVIITPRGQAKVMDFGLAKLSAAIGGGDDRKIDAEASTEAVLTTPGTIIGTVLYMSPEQAAAKKVDARSDIFSFGALLYEMVAGQRAFEADSMMETVAAILNQEPKPFPAKVSPELAKVILRCLRKDPARRYQTMADLKLALEDVREETLSGRRAAVVSRRGWTSVLWPVLLLAAVVVSLFLWQPWRAPKDAEPLRAVALTTLPGIELYPSLSPDGRQVVFAWAGPTQDNQDIYVQMIGQGTPLRLTTDSSNDYNPVWSPDGRWIAFFRSPPPSPSGLRSRELRLIPPLSGTERKLADVRSQDFATGLFPDAVYLAWSLDSNSLIVTDSPGAGQPDALVVVSIETGEKRPLTNPQPPVLADTSPALSPDGNSLVFLRRNTWATGELHLLPLENSLTAAGAPRRLTSVELRADYPAWMPDSKEIIFSAKGGLWRLAVTAESTPTRIPYVGEAGSMPIISRAQPGQPARLVYVHSFADSNLWRVEASAPGVPAVSLPTMAISSTKPEYHCEFSPDGRRVAYVSGGSGEAEIWISDADGTNAIQLTSLGVRDTNCPSWSPDGQLIAFSSTLAGEFDVYVVPAAGGKPRRLTDHPAMDLRPKFSRDGQWIYFSSQRSGDYRIWKMPADGGEAVQVSPNHGNNAWESADGSNIYYQAFSILSPLWRLRISGGDPVKVLDGIVWFNYCLVEKGAYYIDQAGGETRLQYLNFANGKSAIVARNLGPVSAGLTATPDGRTILFTRVDASADDLMMVENFR